MIKRIFHKEIRTDISSLPKEEVPFLEGKFSPDHIVSSLRSDMLPASETSPTGGNIIHKVNFKLVFGTIIAVVILIAFIFFLFGSGRPYLERRLETLIDRREEPTDTLIPSATLTSQHQLIIKETSTPRPSPQPTISPTTRILLPATSQAPTEQPTLEPTITSTTSASSVSACLDASTITLADIGKSLCVQGVVIEIITKPTNYMVIFKTEKGSFYWVTYDVLFAKEEVDHCYRLSGIIEQIANSPVMIFNYGNLPKECP